MNEPDFEQFEKAQKYLQRGYSKTLVAIAVSSKVTPDTILKYKKELEKLES